MISNCSLAETGDIYGTAGDQTSQEYRVQDWYSSPWYCMLRYPDQNVAIRIAEIARDAANNDHIGYSQHTSGSNSRTGFYNQLRANNWNASAINVNCNADCSSSTAACVIGAGYLTNTAALKGISPSITTGGIRSAFTNVGFQLFTAPQYLNSDAYLLPGDVLLRDGTHVCINLDAGVSSGSTINISGGSGSSAVGGYGGNLYEYTNDENDAVLREVAYMNSNGSPTLNKTNLRLSVINYTSALYALFQNRVGCSTVSVDASKLQGNYRIIFEYCMSQGLNAAASCGIIANIRGESNADPAAISGDGNYSYGICQWTFGRKTQMLAHVGSDWQTDLSGQCEFLFIELNGSYRNSTLVPLQQVPNTEQGARSAAWIFVDNFEKPSRYIDGVDIYAQRQDYASEFWSQLIIQQTSSMLSSGAALVGSDNAEKIWNYLYSQVQNPYGVAGIMGNLARESGLDPQNLQNSGNRRLGMTDQQYTVAVDNGTYTNFIHDSIGYGLAQWTYWSRKQNLYNRAKSSNRSIGDLGMQLEYLVEELQGYTTVWSTCKNATSILQASNSVLIDFEAPKSKYSPKTQAERAETSQGYYNMFANKNR